MCGWFRAAIERASWLNRSLCCPFVFLTATIRSRRVSRAFHTSPIPPEPMHDIRAYGPITPPASQTIVSVGGLLEAWHALGPERGTHPREGIVAAELRDGAVSAEPDCMVEIVEEGLARRRSIEHLSSEVSCFNANDVNG